MTHYHFVGIGGTGLSAIARVLYERGEKVSGSDMNHSPAMDELASLGVQVYEGHHQMNIGNADILIRSSAIPDENPEVIAANKIGIPVLKRRDFLRQLTANKKVIAIAGTHGKTTTTAMIAWCLSQSGLDPSYVIGSESKDLGKNAASGDGDYFVIEADEYDNMFLGLSPYILIITNIEHDHPDCFPTESLYKQAFIQLINNMQPGGYLIICNDDSGAKSILPQITDAIRKITYGKEQDSNLQIMSSVSQRQGAQEIAIQNNSEYLALSEFSTFTLQIPGLHNALNATATIAATTIIDADLGQVQKSLASFSGTGRRFEIVGRANGAILIDDYGHHPTEIKATLSAARDMFASKELWVVWQPHTYSRTQELFNDFVLAFSDCDHVIATEIYRSREPEQDYSAFQVVDQMEHPDKHFIATLDDAERFLRQNLGVDDVLIVFSAGDANKITHNLLQKSESDE